MMESPLNEDASSFAVIWRRDAFVTYLLHFWTWDVANPKTTTPVSNNLFFLFARFSQSELLRISSDGTVASSKDVERILLHCFSRLVTPTPTPPQPPRRRRRRRGRGRGRGRGRRRRRQRRRRRRCLQHYCRLQVLVTGRTRYWSTSAHLVCVPLAVQARTCHSSCFWSTGQPPLGQSLSASTPSPSIQRSAVKPEAHTVHSTWRYFAGAVQIWYTVNRLLQQTLLHKPLPFYGFVCVFLSYSSSPSFLFCSLAGFHLESTSNSLGATSLMAGGLAQGN